MKKIYILIICISFFSNTNAQEPYFGTAGADGLGQYGYLDKNSVTFSRIFRNSYNNIAFLSARWWITDNNAANGNGKEFIYNVFSGPDWNPAIGWQCGGDNDGSKRTTDFVAADFSPEWSAGSDCYVSVCAKYCDNSFSPNSFNGATTFGAVGFNERHFQVIEVNTAAHTSTASFIPNTSGICQTSNAVNVAGSFSIDPGTISGISLSSLFVKNKGTAMEGTDIPNNALHVYYETATGSERYGDGNETFAGTLNGNWDGNVTDNIFGSSVLSIPLNGKIISIPL